MWPEPRVRARRSPDRPTRRSSPRPADRQERSDECPTALEPRAVAAAIAGALALHAAPARADSFSLGDVDKQAHLSVSYGLTLTGAVVARRFGVKRWQAVAVAAASTLVLGTFKELVVDDTYSWGDQLANGLGAGTAAVVVLSFRL